ncbi:helix-turn-helix domain-containing protein [Tenacibaculum xiamenense]|uniref:helix-turn-helix domain-containing protein n=1 Tax=Tenacibaculum xiamenense TaxID=1261553 RepID=UPI00389423E9
MFCNESASSRGLIKLVLTIEKLKLNYQSFVVMEFQVFLIIISILFLMVKSLSRVPELQLSYSSKFAPSILKIDLSCKGSIDYFDDCPSMKNTIIPKGYKKQIKETLPETLTILSYFATSLFNKNSIESVFWDIVENCISHLGLEDCVIYYVENDKLIQKAAFGNKGNGAEQKVLSPITINMGEGIVGAVAQKGVYQIVNDTSMDNRYIVDDALRKSELAVPIVVNKVVIGVLDSESSIPNFYTKNHLFLFQLLANLIEKKIQKIYEKGIKIKHDNIYFEQATELMEKSKIYRDSKLSLNCVASKLNISANYLSQIINKLQGCNFSDFLNAYRVKDVKRKIKNHHFSQYTILSIGLEAGFNSKSAFYNAFKKHTGVSPSQYRAKVIKKS